MGGGNFLNHQGLICLVTISIASGAYLIAERKYGPGFGSMVLAHFYYTSLPSSSSLAVVKPFSQAPVGWKLGLAIKISVIYNLGFSPNSITLRKHLFKSQNFSIPLSETQRSLLKIIKNSCPNTCIYIFVAALFTLAKKCNPNAHQLMDKQNVLHFTIHQ